MAGNKDVTELNNEEMINTVKSNVEFYKNTDNVEA